ncbi:hypothetical protein [Dyadobacter sp. LHD-138]|uniref:hypothetical protein n=1 Tax=Dyadobacter sp. LHD-138 TaxID=3071413 RepID=UPI0027E1D9C7|nr:hypothetical protein [Dyadobacter sp. LHD-138]MDQ6482528.1 hypothetical protein [Dyadobacter sp. LHD-138]
MALWQYNFFILPLSSYDKFWRQEKLKVDKDSLFDDSVFWKNTGIRSDFFSEIEEILSRSKSWSKDLLIYGNVESNVFEIFIEADLVASVSFRIDLTSQYRHILDYLINFMILKGLVIVGEDLESIPLNSEQIKAKMLTSSQFLKYKRLSKNEIE